MKRYRPRWSLPQHVVLPGAVLALPWPCSSSAWIVAGLLGISLSLVPDAAFGSESVEMHAFSDVVHRGVNLTEGQPALGLNASYDFSSGLFIGVGGHYASGEATGQELLRSLNAHVGWFKSLDRQQALEVSLSHYEFDDVSNWSYSELRGDWHLSNRVSITAAWSPDYYGRAESVNFAATWKPTLSDRTYLILSGGPGWLGDEVDEALFWGTVGLGARIANFDIELSYSAVNDATERLLLTPGNSLALRVSYRLR